MGKKILVLHSGGLDSSVCLLKALKEKHAVVSLSIDYGQRHIIELEYASNFCRKFNIPHKVIQIKWDKPYRNRTIPESRSVEEIREGTSPAFLPGRNILFLSIALAESAGIEASEIWVGINSIDFSGYPDCTPEFLNEFKKMAQVGMPYGPKIVAPLLKMSKPEIANLGASLGISQLDTWSCYQPKFSNIGIVKCGICDACILHKYAWNHVKEKNK